MRIDATFTVEDWDQWQYTQGLRDGLKHAEALLAESTWSQAMTVLHRDIRFLEHALAQVEDYYNG